MPSGPIGFKLNEGFSTVIGLQIAPNIAFWEKQITPPGLDGGGPNDTTTMRNNIWRTMQPKALISMTPITVRAAYDPAVIFDLASTVINVVTLIGVEFSDGSAWYFYGWLNSFKPDRIVEGSQPEAEVEFICGNQKADGTESGPTYFGPGDVRPFAIEATTTSTTTTTTSTTHTTTTTTP